MPALELFTFRRCPYAMRVRMVLFEKGLPFTRFEEDLKNPSADLLSINPEGSVPVLRHQGQVIRESAVITEYLEDMFPTPALMPLDPLARAQVRLWTRWCDDLLKPDLDAFKYEYETLPEPARSELVARLRARIQELAEPLASRAFLLGDQLTLADIHLFPFYRQLSRANKEFEGVIALPEPLARLGAWLERLTLRPSFKETMEK